jgi:hypothetical protein
MPRNGRPYLATGNLFLLTLDVGWQWTMDEQAAVAMTNLIAISIALGLSRLPILFRPLFPKHSKTQHHVDDRTTHGDISDGIHLEENTDAHRDPTPAHAAGGTATQQVHRRSLSQFDSIGEGIANACHVIFRGRIEVGMEDTGIRKLRRQVAKNARDDPIHFYGAIIFAISLAALFVLEQSLAILSSNITSGSMVLSRHPDCGYWNLDVNAFNVSDSHSWMKAVLTGILEGRALQLKALNYADGCYNANKNLENCNTLATPMIDYVVERNSACPFPSEVCRNGPSSALTMDTGFQSLSRLGLNLPFSGSFRRKVTCAPLTDRFIRIRPGPDNSTLIVEYLHGYLLPKQNHTEIPILWSHLWPDEEINDGDYHLE